MSRFDAMVSFLLFSCLGLTACSEASKPTPVALAAPRCAHVPAAHDWVFMTFFDLHSDQIATPRQQQVMADIAGTFVRYRVSSLEAFGHTDNSETTKSDLHLGARRAQAVRASLVGAGIKPEIITIHDSGAATPLVPTSPGIPEPQNRRVEFRPVLHVSDEELPHKRECEDWLRQHATQCEPNTKEPSVRQACTEVRHALTYWYLPD